MRSIQWIGSTCIKYWKHIVLSAGIILLHKHLFSSNCQRQSFFELPNRKWLSSRQPTFTISFYFSCRSIRCRIKGDWDRTNTLTAFLPVNANSWCQSQHESPGNIFETCWPCDCPLTAFLPVNVKAGISANNKNHLVIFLKLLDLGTVHSRHFYLWMQIVGVDANNTGSIRTFSKYLKDENFCWQSQITWHLIG